MSFFQKRTTGNIASTPIDKLYGLVNDSVQANKYGSPQLAGAALSIESISDSTLKELNNTLGTLEASLEAIAEELGISKITTKAQIQAGAAAGILAGDVKGFMNQKVDQPRVSTENMSVVSMGNVADSMSSRFSLEAYHESENKAAAQFSIVYNMQAARQDDFCETFFPTIVTPPDNAGFAVTVRLMTVYNEFTRNVSGALDNYDKKNIIRALADPTILKNDSTRIIPVWRDVAKSNFVDAGLIPVRTISLEGESIVTSPLATGKRFSLLAISQTDALLANGVMDMTDSIDPTVTLVNVYVKVGDDILSIPVENLPLSNFTYSTQSNYRQMTLNFTTHSVLVNKNTKRMDGSDLTTLASLKTNDLIARLTVSANGSVNIETAETVVHGNECSVHIVRNAAGEEIPMTVAPALDLVNAFADAKIIGYDLRAWRSNVNRRQRGQLIDTTYFTQLYNVPLRAPITAIHPVTQEGQTDTSDITSLVTATHIRTSNAGVASLIQAESLLREYVDARDTLGIGPDVLGVGRFFVRPTFFEEELDMNELVDSLKSHERAQDLQAALVNKLRDYAYRMWRDSEYPAAANALCGGIAPVPTVIIGTDPVLARYLNVTGDLRTLGSEFNVRIVSTLDRRVSGKIYMAFGVFDENRNTAPNPLNFGNMAWSPELTIVLPISRNNQISRETAVSPRFLHFTNCPILTVLSVINVPDVLKKLPINMHTV